MAGDARRRRILVVDDDREIRGVTRLVLEEEGYAVEEAADGEQAIRTALAQPFDLILLDVNMPVMTGWQALRILKGDPVLSAVPVVMFSVKGELRDKVHGLQDGALDYITKPFAVDELAARVRRALEDASAARASGPAGA